MFPSSFPVLSVLSCSQQRKADLLSSLWIWFVQITQRTLRCTHMHRGGSERQFISNQTDELLSDHDSTSIAVVSEKQKHVVIWAATICWFKHGGNISILLLMVLLHASTACHCQNTKAGILRSDHWTRTCELQTANITTIKCHPVISKYHIRNF